MANETTTTALVPQAVYQQPIEYRGLNTKQLKALKKVQDREQVFNFVEHLSDKGVDIIKTIIGSQPLTALGAFILIEWLQNVTYEKELSKIVQVQGDQILVHERYWLNGVPGLRVYWTTRTDYENRKSTELVPVMPQMAGNVLEGAIIANMLLEGESGSSIMGLIGGLLGL